MAKRRGLLQKDRVWAKTAIRAALFIASVTRAAPAISSRLDKEIAKTVGRSADGRRDVVAVLVCTIRGCVVINEIGDGVARREATETEGVSVLARKRCRTLEAV